MRTSPPLAGKYAIKSVFPYYILTRFLYNVKNKIKRRAINRAALFCLFHGFQ